MLRAIILLLLPLLCNAQARFDVASIKPHPFQGIVGRIAPPVRIAGNRVTVEVASLNELIAAAYDVREFQIRGTPGWATEGTNRFDLEAIAPGSDPPTPEAVRPMLQALLAERFQLRLHQESTQVRVFHLTAEPGPTKWKQTEPGSPRPAPPVQRLPMSLLETLIASLLDRPLINQTGITGTIDFTLDFASIQKDQVAVTTALRESLGWKLEPASDTLPILVIERVERPSEN